MSTKRWRIRKGEIFGPIWVCAMLASPALAGQTRPATGSAKQPVPVRNAKPVNRSSNASKGRSTEFPLSKNAIAALKDSLEKSTNPPLYVKDVLKKKFILDTVLIFSTSQFGGVRDSLAYRGKIGKVYGPFDHGRVLVQVLAKSNGTYNRVSQIFLDTSIYTQRFADSLAGSIMKRITAGTSSFEDMVMTYSTGSEVGSRGDLGWLAAGSMLPPIEMEIAKRKKGEVFKVWTPSGLHILQKTQNPKQDIAAALIMRILL